MTLIRATHLKRVNRNGVIASVALYLPELRASLFGCALIEAGNSERIVLPRREWLDRKGEPHNAEIFVFDHAGVQQAFESGALAAVRQLVRATKR